MRTKEPNFCKRLAPISGDILETNLKISDKNLELLKENVNVVFHLAGTVQLDQDLKQELIKFIS